MTESATQDHCRRRRGPAWVLTQAAASPGSKARRHGRCAGCYLSRLAGQPAHAVATGLDRPPCPPTPRPDAPERCAGTTWHETPGSPSAAGVSSPVVASRRRACVVLRAPTRFLRTSSALSATGSPYCRSRAFAVRPKASAAAPRQIPAPVQSALATANTATRTLSPPLAKPAKTAIPTKVSSRFGFLRIRGSVLHSKAATFDVEPDSLSHGPAPVGPLVPPNDAQAYGTCTTTSTGPRRPSVPVSSRGRCSTILPRRDRQDPLVGYSNHPRPVAQSKHSA